MDVRNDSVQVNSKYLTHPVSEWVLKFTIETSGWGGNALSQVAILS